MIRTTPFWEADISDQILKGVLSPLDVVESFVELSEAERQNLKANYSDQSKYSRFLTIYKLSEIPAELQPQFFAMADKVLALEARYGHRLIVTSFFRSMTHHLRVYKEKGITDPKLIPMKSWHLYCWAVDLVPENMPIAHFQAFLTEEILKEFDLWMEHPLDTPKWGHVQGQAYGSWTHGKSRKYRIKS